MGGQDSKPKQQDFFFLDHLSKMSLTNRKTVSYYLIHPQRDSKIEDLLKGLRTFFKVDHFPQIKTLKQEMSFVNKHEIVKIIASSDLPQADVEYLQNEAKVYQIILLGPNNYKPNFSKIAKIVENYNDLQAALTQLEQKDSLTISSSNILLVDSDTKLLNKYRLNYQCNTNFNGRAQAKQDFIALAKHLFPNDLTEIEKFTSEYNLELAGEQKTKMVLQWAFKDSFFWKMVSGLTRNTTDPKRLAYIRLALKDIFQTISSQFKKKKSYEEVYIVVDLTEQQKQRLQKASGHYILFTSFVKGYLNEKQANAQLKARPSAFRFMVQPNRGNLAQSIDFGFVVNKDTVIYNIYNVFRVDEINIRTRRADILYGSLPSAFLKRQIQDKRQEMSELQLDMVRNYDYIEDTMSKIDSQATLLQLYGYHNESLEVYNKKIDNIRKSKDSEENVGRCLIQKADALRASGDFDSAEKEYSEACSLSEKMKIISKIHLAELYLQKGEQTKFNELVTQLAEEIRKHQQQIKKSNKEEYFKAMNLIAVKAINVGNRQDLINAEKILNQLLPEINAFYGHGLEGKALVHDTYRTKATCQLKLQRHNEALSLLKSTLKFQIACEGRSANVALTETLIQSVCHSSKTSSRNGKTTMGSSNIDYEKQLNQSLERMSQISEEIESTDSLFSSVIASKLSRTVNESSIQISISG